MRKHNIGRISFLVILLNVILVSVYLVAKNDTSFTDDGKQIQTSMVIYKDETVPGDKVTMLENIIADKQYDQIALKTISEYQWYLTDNVATTNSYILDEEHITLYTGTEFQENVNTVLQQITGVER